MLPALASVAAGHECSGEELETVHAMDIDTGDFADDCDECSPNCAVCVCCPLRATPAKAGTHFAPARLFARGDVVQPPTTNLEGYARGLFRPPIT